MTVVISPAAGVKVTVVAWPAAGVIVVVTVTVETPGAGLLSTGVGLFCGLEGTTTELNVVPRTLETRTLDTCPPLQDPKSFWQLLAAQ